MFAFTKFRIKLYVPLIVYNSLIGLSNFVGHFFYKSFKFLQPSPLRFHSKLQLTSVNKVYFK